MLQYRLAVTSIAVSPQICRQRGEFRLRRWLLASVYVKSRSQGCCCLIQTLTLVLPSAYLHVKAAKDWRSLCRQLALLINPQQTDNWITGLTDTRLPKDVLVYSCQSSLHPAATTAAFGRVQIHPEHRTERSYRGSTLHGHTALERLPRHPQPGGLPFSSSGCHQPSQPGETVLFFTQYRWSGGTPGAHLLCEPPGAEVRAELVQGLDCNPEGEVSAGPAGESCAGESLHPPGLTQHPSG